MRENFANKKRIVIKIGSSSLIHTSTGKLNFLKIDKLARVLTDLKNAGKDIVLVSSGAIAVGVSELGLISKPKDTAIKQAVAAVGQASLMEIYRKSFADYNQKVAQILLTKDIIDIKKRKENANNTFNALFDMNVIPIVNENDTVSVEEIEFGDNDSLSALVAKVINADLLILLSDIDGLYDKNPKNNKDAKFIEEVDEITPDIEKLAENTCTSIGTGGMITKISAAKIVTSVSIDMVIANAENIHNIYNIINGDNIGTYFCGKKTI